MIEVKVKFVGLDPHGEQRVVVLEEANGDRYFTMSVSVADAEAVSTHLNGDASGNHPSIFDLTLTLIRLFGGSIKQVVIDEPRIQHFSAEIELSCGDDIPALPCKPVDGIALAMRARVPIFVTERLADQTMRRLPRHPRPPDRPPSVG